MSPSRVSIVMGVLLVKGLALCLRKGVPGPGGAPGVWKLAEEADGKAKGER